jgi:hypothetical protein
MTISSHPPIPTDPPVAGRAGNLRLRDPHKNILVDPHTDPLTIRLTFLLRSNPGLVKFRADDLAGLDTATKKLLLSQIDEVLGLDTHTPSIIASNG